MTGAAEGLTVAYRAEGLEGLGELHVSARATPFAGASVGYVNDADLLDWTRSLLVYPWSTTARPQISSALGDQKTLNLTAFTVTGRGQLAVSVHLATVDTDAHSPTTGTVSEARLLVLTTYEAVHRFANDLAAAISNAGGSAHLDLEELA
ncbi:hypothetical protein GCM10022415_15920 [Knoellia locipacati]|uniref:Uncharacterized protein n=1 Tax=Knoellia locipacati TaxID=882824 RepID=A0A512T019_9MICO|nr:hypothetical protein [Knoellia locipacati]GEQ13542.1 hypothetical protein KLO01_15890 [Knoellia locipacati]